VGAVVLRCDRAAVDLGHPCVTTRQLRREPWRGRVPCATTCRPQSSSAVSTSAPEIPRGPGDPAEDPGEPTLPGVYSLAVADLDVLRRGGWIDVDLPDALAEYPTMLAYEERQLLYWLARDVWEGSGAIIDAGCFLGGSTASLASGLRARPGYSPAGRPGWPIATYDRFEVEGYTVDAGFFDSWPNIGTGDSFRPAFDESLGGLASETTVSEGDITTAGWSGEPIEILFLDVLKSWEVNDAVSGAFLPPLIAGRSVIVQQDYIHGMLPWIHITMELLGDSLEQVADVCCSRVYAVTGDITAGRLDEILPLRQCVSPARQEQLMDAAIAATSGNTTASLLLAKANLLRHHGDLARATQVLERVEAMFGDAPAVVAEANETRAVLLSAGHSNATPGS
jgi:hypothetical protein